VRGVFCLSAAGISPGTVLEGVEAAMVFPKRAARLLGISEIFARPASRAGTVSQTAHPTPAAASLRIYADQVGHDDEEEEVGEGAAEDVDSVEAAHRVRSGSGVTVANDARRADIRREDRQQLRLPSVPDGVVQVGDVYRPGACVS